MTIHRLSNCCAARSATTLGVVAQNEQPAGASPDMLAELKSYPHKILIETKRDGNWEIYRINADGSDLLNLSRTLEADELYPKASPDGSMICFEVDEGRGDQRAQNLYVMKADGSGQK
jgi:Tol biopolymer transport system component